MLKAIEWLVLRKSARNFNTDLLREAEYQAAVYAAMVERASADAANKLLESEQCQNLANMYAERAARLRVGQD